ncbi:hypothetical protein BC629DRAFT_1599197 [Irpex lacteus]|nr:hypothetical protein BC629DRAFT_1599197 [Irpex lacteus]
MSLEPHGLPLRLQEDDSEHNVECHNWPDLPLSSFSDTAKIPPDPTMLGHYYSRAMQIHARRYGGGHALLTPSIFRIPLPPIRPDYAIIGDIGLLWRGTFKPLWSPWTPGGTKIPQPRHPHSIHVRTFNDYDPRVYTKRIEPNEYPQVLEARLPGSSENGKDLYARLEVTDDSELQMVFCISDPRFMLAMCSSYDHLQELAPQLREDERYKDLTGPMEYVMCTGGISALRWKTLVGDEMPTGAEYDSTKAPAQNGMGRRIESVGKVDEHTERAWVSIRFNKCLSRKVYKARGKLDEGRLPLCLSTYIGADKLE